MKYKTATVKMPAPNTTSYTGEIDSVLFAFDEEGYEVISVAPVCKDGNTEEFVVVAKKTDSN